MYLPPCTEWGNDRSHLYKWCLLTTDLCTLRGQRVCSWGKYHLPAEIYRHVVQLVLKWHLVYGCVVHHFQDVVIHWPTACFHLVTLSVCKLLSVSNSVILNFDHSVAPSHLPICSPSPPAGMMWTTVWPPLWGLDDVSDVTLLKRAVSPMGRWPLTFLKQ